MQEAESSILLSLIRRLGRTGIERKIRKLEIKGKNGQMKLCSHYHPTSTNKNKDGDTKKKSQRYEGDKTTEVI